MLPDWVIVASGYDADALRALDETEAVNTAWYKNASEVARERSACLNAPPQEDTVKLEALCLPHRYLRRDDGGEQSWLRCLSRWRHGTFVTAPSRRSAEPLTAEVRLYPVCDGKIDREQFFYGIDTSPSRGRRLSSGHQNHPMRDRCPSMAGAGVDNGGPR